MKMGGGTGRSEEPLEALVDVDRLKARIEGLYKAVEARNKSTEAHKSARADALEAIEKLKQARSEHDERERQLNTKNSEIEGLKSYLADQIAEYGKKFDDISEEKHNFEESRVQTQQILAKASTDLDIREKGLIAKKQELDVREAEMEKRYTQLVQREGWVADAEADIRDFAYKLSQSNRK